MCVAIPHRYSKSKAQHYGMHTLFLPTHVHVHKCAHAHNTCRHEACMYPHAHTRTHACTHAHTHMHTERSPLSMYTHHTHAHAHTRTCTHTHAHMHACTHAHTCTQKGLHYQCIHITHTRALHAPWWRHIHTLTHILYTYMS